MRTNLFLKTKKPWKPFTWFNRNDPETDDIMCQGYRMIICTVFFIGLQIIWAEWDDNH